MVGFEHCIGNQRWLCDRQNPGASAVKFEPLVPFGLSPYSPRSGIPFHKLALTAEKGYYLAPYARLLMAVAAVRDKNQAKARELLAGLSSEFPRNELLKKELGRNVELQNR